MMTTDELPIAKLYKPGQVVLAKREALEQKRDSTMPSYEEWHNQMLAVPELSVILNCINY